MNTALLPTILLTLAGYAAAAQCTYVSANSPASGVTYSFSGGSFQNFGCAPVDPTYWISGSGKTVTITFATPQTNPSFRVWGMNDDDVASIRVNNVGYPLTAASASYDAKVVCGLSPGPNGVAFISGNLTGANTNTQGNYSYQNIRLHAANVSSVQVLGLSGAGWGFTGVSVNCPLMTIRELAGAASQRVSISPNPFSSTAVIQAASNQQNSEAHIYNAQGQQVKTITFTGDKARIDRGNLPAGIYYVGWPCQLGKTNKLVIID